MTDTISFAAIQLLCDMLEEKETELAITGDDKDSDALGELWELYQSQMRS